jgi:hypothetical protein
VLNTNSAFPPKLRDDLTAFDVASTALEMAVRVVGGTMSRRASRRSASVSSRVGRSSSSEEISESNKSKD